MVLGLAKYGLILSFIGFFLIVTGTTFGLYAGILFILGGLYEFSLAFRLFKKKTK